MQKEGSRTGHTQSMTPKSIRTISWLLYPEVTDYTALLTAICALYYLPENYHLLVAADEASAAMLMPPDHEAIEHRIHFRQKDNTTWQAVKDSHSRVLLYDQAEAVPKNEKHKQTPIIFIQQDPLDRSTEHNNSHQLSILIGQPDALASLVLSHT